jgi:DNA-binding winged helix-turn-helix (wHTH) protein
MSGIVRFGVYELDPERMTLLKHGTRIPLQEQPFRVLLSLIERPGEIVTREQLRERIWPPSTFVDFDQSLNKAVNRLRDVLNDDAGQPRYIETVPRRGYRFVAPVAKDAPVETTQPTQIQRRRSMPIAITVAGLLTLGGAAMIHLSKPTKPALRVTNRMTSDGRSFDPALSSDGRLLAYASAAGGDVAHIWLRQIGGAIVQGSWITSSSSIWFQKFGSPS